MALTTGSRDASRLFLAACAVSLLAAASLALTVFTGNVPSGILFVLLTACTVLLVIARRNPNGRCHRLLLIGNPSEKRYIFAAMVGGIALGAWLFTKGSTGLAHLLWGCMAVPALRLYLSRRTS
ncbi:hypothetical protein [Streptomyces californicus]|uniref:hypothetical protein n=1 Tax=Streptomyces californicus TaxID=67351 RepID=UPI00368D23DF